MIFFQVSTISLTLSIETVNKYTHYGYCIYNPYSAAWLLKKQVCELGTDEPDE